MTPKFINEVENNMFCYIVLNNKPLLKRIVTWKDLWLCLLLGLNAKQLQFVISMRPFDTPMGDEYITLS